MGRRKGRGPSGQKPARINKTFTPAFGKGRVVKGRKARR